MVTSRFFFKMLLLRQFLTELNDTLIQCSPICSLYMVLTDGRFGSYDVTDDVISKSRIIIIATLELNISETRPDSGMVSMYSQ